jgi:transcriptional regulator with XRE-family HTH domain
VPPSAPPTSAQLGAAIRLLREQRKITIEALAIEAEVHWTYLSIIERGKGNPSWDVLRRLAVALEVEILELVRQGSEQIASDD